jgi:hypothetical protein
MVQSTSQHRTQWALAKRAIGQQLRLDCELPQELSPDLTALLNNPNDRENDPYADIVGTC